MKTVAFVTYNTVGQTTSGWHDGSEGRRGLVLQNATGNERFATLASEGDKVSDEIARLWQILTEQLPTLDAVVIYVGTNGSEKAIELARVLDPSKVMFVLCDCSLHAKTALIHQSGLQESRQIVCECRGVATMQRLFRSFLETGILN